MLASQAKARLHSDLIVRGVEMSNMKEKEKTTRTKKKKRFREEKLEKLSVVANTLTLPPWLSPCFPCSKLLCYGPS